MTKIKNTVIFLAALVCLLIFSSVYAQTEEAVILTSVKTDNPVYRMVWNDTGTVITLVTKNSVEHVVVSDPVETDQYELGEKTYTLTTVSETGVVAALSGDGETIYIYDPNSAGKEVKTIVPGFKVLSVSVSKDGSQVVADSAEKIRTVVFDAGNGSVVYDLSGFETAAPVYDSSLSPDGKSVLWHARGTFALQNAADASFGKTISLWDFASSFELSPDSSLLAVGIVNDDYENGAVLFFDPVSGLEKGRTILGKTPPNELSFSNDGSVLWATDVNSVYQIDPKTFELKAQDTITEDESRILRLAASPDGQSAAVLLNNGDLRLVTK